MSALRPQDEGPFLVLAYFTFSISAAALLYTPALTITGSFFMYGFSFSAVFPMSLPPEVAKRMTLFPAQSSFWQKLFSEKELF